jgi:hypothetical protein
MPLFRQHRGSLKSSLKTTIIVKNKDDIKNAILNFYFDFLIDTDSGPKDEKSLENMEIKIEPYFGQLDERCGWYTQMVSIRFSERTNYCLLGFLSEPLDET